MLKYQAPRGTRDFLPADMVVRNRVESVVRGTFESYGFQQVQTPIFEQYDLLAARSGEEIKESMFTFASDAGRYALRPELTAPICRVVASNALSDSRAPYKLYYFGPCFRYCRPQAGRYREFYQAGIELMGSQDALADAESIAVAVKTLTRLGIAQFQLRVGDVGVFRGLLEEYLDRDGQSQERQSRVITDIDKLMNLREKCSTFASQNELSQDDQLYLGNVSNALHKLQGEIDYTGEFEILPDRPATPDWLPAVAEATFRASWVFHRILAEDKADLFVAVSRIRGPAGDALNAARELLSGTTALPPLENLSEVCSWLPALGVSNFEVVLGMARNLDFYTGTVFEVDSPLLGAQRQVAGGGRYDKLVEEFGGPALPATGFAFGFDRLVEAYKKTLEQCGQKANDSAVDVLVISAPTQRREAVELAERLREGDLKVRAAVPLVGASLRDQRDYCDKLGATFTVAPLVVELLGDGQFKVTRGRQGPETVVGLSSLEEEVQGQLKKGTS